MRKGICRIVRCRRRPTLAQAAEAAELHRQSFFQARLDEWTPRDLVRRREESLQQPFAGQPPARSLRLVRLQRQLGSPANLVRAYRRQFARC